MRAFPVAISACALALIGCANAFSRQEIVPPTPEHAGTLSQSTLEVREIGVAHEAVLFHFSGLSQLAVVVDARNKSMAPLTLDAGKAWLDFAWACSSKKTRAVAIASGDGHLPARLDANGAGFDGAVTLRPGEARTFWMVFERVDEITDCTSVLLTMRTTSGEPAVVSVLDPSTTPHVTDALSRGALGLSIGLSEQDFGGADLVKVRESVWYARGAIKGGLSFEAGRLFERSPDGFQEANTLGAGLSLSWRPPLVTGGVFAAGHLTHAIFENPAILGRRGWADLSVGLEVPVRPGTLPAAFVRLGYTRVFDDRTPDRNALLFSIDVRYAIWSR